MQTHPKYLQEKYLSPKKKIKETLIQRFIKNLKKNNISKLVLAFR